eukprot:12239809-Prorocentrum_lima.AAC.1
MALQFLQSHEGITRDNVTQVLAAWGLYPNTSRQNILGDGQTFVYSDTFGLLYLKEHREPGILALTECFPTWSSCSTAG